MKNEGKCLGYTWNSNLSSLPMIKERIQKARKTFFQFGSIHAFQGNLSPVSTSSTIQCCVLPVLLYGIENWIMCTESLKELGQFQGELAKRTLKLPKWYSNTAACIALGWNSIHSICTIRKLRFLSRVMTNQQSICYRAFSALVDDVESISLVRECRELEERYNCNFTSELLNTMNPEERTEIVKEAENIISKKDCTLLLSKGSTHYHLCLIAESVGWKKLWDHALDCGPSTIKAVRNLVRVITYPDYARNKCPLCEVAELNISLPEHVLSQHTNSTGTWEDLMNSVTTIDSSFYSHILCLASVF